MRQAQPAIARYKLIDFPRRTRTSLADVPLEAADEVTAQDENLNAESTFDLKRLMQRLPEKMRFDSGGKTGWAECHNLLDDLRSDSPSVGR